MGDMADVQHDNAMMDGIYCEPVEVDDLTVLYKGRAIRRQWGKYTVKGSSIKMRAVGGPACSCPDADEQRRTFTEKTASASNDKQQAFSGIMKRLAEDI